MFAVLCCHLFTACVGWALICPLLAVCCAGQLSPAHHSLCLLRNALTCLRFCVLDCEMSPVHTSFVCRCLCGETGLHFMFAALLICHLFTVCVCFALRSLLFSVCVQCVLPHYSDVSYSYACLPRAVLSLVHTLCFLCSAMSPAHSLCDCS